MFQHIGTVSLFVADQDRAKDFYTDKLGFELVTDVPLYPGATIRWLSVKPSSTAATELILYLPDDNWSHYAQVVGKPQALTVNVSDITTLHQDLQAKGVTFVQEPDTQPWGTYATIEDSEGNHLILVEQSAP
ncbi:MAG: VOC family protein [Chloroflexota bacterium]